MKTPSYREMLICLTLSQTSPGFLRVCRTSLLKTLWEKEKLLVTSNFSFSHSVLYPSGELSAIFLKFKIVVCKLFQFGRVKNLSFGKGLKLQLDNEQRINYIICEKVLKHNLNFNYNHWITYNGRYYPGHNNRVTHRPCSSKIEASFENVDTCL